MCRSEGLDEDTGNIPKFENLLVREGGDEVVSQKSVKVKLIQLVKVKSS